MHDERTLLEERLNRTLKERIRPALYGESVPLTLEVWNAPDEPVPVAEALAAQYVPAQVGDSWGPPWGTSWFRMSGRVPDTWRDKQVEAVIDLGFTHPGPGFQAEGLAYTPDGVPIKGIEPRNTYIPVDGDEVLFYLEAAGNPTILDFHPFLPTQLGDKETAGTDPLYKILRADLAVFQPEVWHLILDIEVLQGLMKELQDHDPRRHKILRALDKAMDRLDVQNVAASGSYARDALVHVLSLKASASAHKISAVGHAHIDSAWLWPLRETVRKCARTFSNVTALMDQYPDFVFACSQAQQYAWMKEHHPHVFDRIKAKVANGQFVPVGGMWVESDTNMPGGEAMARQLVHGKRFFLDEFGVETFEVWLPDSFGYSAALPQLIKLSGSRWFLTQKLSWNQINKFPHHTFWWEGIDGTRIFTHFPPVDTYNSSLSGEELARASRQFAEHADASRSLVPFGYGDGGGGPTREMMETAHRVADLEGSPTVTVEAPLKFFATAEEEYPNAPVWAGELYLEKHRATYTTQAKTKQGNRRSEHLLREAEHWCTAAALNGFDYPYEQLDALWKTVLLHQFHDILPGSSIAWVHREAEETYARVATELDGITSAAISSLAGPGESEVVFDVLGDRQRGAFVDGHEGVLDNGILRVTVDRHGLLTSIYDYQSGREIIAPSGAGNLPQLHADTPNQWDAWDIDPFYRNSKADLVPDDRLDGGPGIVVQQKFGASTMTQRISLREGSRQVDFETEVDWHECEKLLKIAFPLDLRAEASTAETQFGHLHRPIHTNTSWENAKFEICAHRWLHVGEPGFGVAIVNDSTYGHDVTRTTRPDGGTTTTVRLSLLRAPRFPDPETDQGEHRFRYSLVVGGIPEAIDAGYRINLPPRVVRGSSAVEPLVTLDNPAVRVEAVKLADDRSGDVVVRLYEAHGGRAHASLRTSFPFTRIQETDLLERPLGDLSGDLTLRPFQVITLRITPEGKS
ncbi:alpha-mannosidase [Lentzea sp. NBRC 105346]|uniref:alpha-mannosidase n=1 Tax=Lentzea sp. NBRC 105346 TaxID=3032205 RepID=UPI00249FE762|nr:glycoside hydrolase family 38 C-terminal domain-containing protein [Lentzea sp. NBRC 105346]GLZ34819.1 alpha-mannosidase [Lentzea sp. NBRC 105346]